MTDLRNDLLCGGDLGSGRWSSKPLASLVASKTGAARHRCSLGADGCLRGGTWIDMSLAAFRNAPKTTVTLHALPAGHVGTAKTIVSKRFQRLGLARECTLTSKES